jgi:uncharacterized surface protein with fasciclin (FAS1) repeats
MKSTINFLAVLLFGINAFIITGCEDYKEEPASIAGIAVANNGFSVLEDAAVRGGVAVTLSNKNAGDPSGAFTVFAPNDVAFAKLGFKTGDDLGALQPAFLTSTLLYHVSNGNKAASILTNNASIASLQGPSNRIIVKGADKYINGSKIIATDISAQNGTVHVIDKVMLSTGVDIVNSAIALTQSKVFTGPELTYLVEALVYADLVSALVKTANSPSFTVFAPTDNAFRALGVALGVPLNVPADIRKLPKAVVTAVLLNHVVANGGKFNPELGVGTLSPLGEAALTIGAFENGVITVKGKSNTSFAKMVIPDVLTTNGVVHIIDTVLLP